jgi:hypothetical protein
MDSLLSYHITSNIQDLSTLHFKATYNTLLSLFSTLPNQNPLDTPRTYFFPQQPTKHTINKNHQNMTFKPTQTRAFFRTLRNMVREEHPFARNTNTLLPHKHDNLVLMRRTAGNFAVFVPFIA